MTSVSSSAGTVAAELIQSRDANASEALVIMRTQGAAFRRRLAGIRGYRTARFAWLGLIVGLFAAFILATKMHWIPRMSAWISVPLMFVGGIWPVPHLGAATTIGFVPRFIRAA